MLKHFFGISLGLVIIFLLHNCYHYQKKLKSSRVNNIMLGKEYYNCFLKEDSMFDFVTGPAEHMCFSLQRELAIARIDPAPFEVWILNSSPYLSSNNSVIVYMIETGLVPLFGVVGKCLNEFFRQIKHNMSFIDLFKMLFFFVLSIFLALFTSTIYAFFSEIIKKLINLCFFSVFLILKCLIFKIKSHILAITLQEVIPSIDLALPNTNHPLPISWNDESRERFFNNAVNLILDGDQLIEDE